MQDYNTPLDLNWVLRVVITCLGVVCGLIYSLKSVANYFLVEYGSNSRGGVESETTSSMVGVVGGGDSCVVCGSLTTKQCSRCKGVRYCSASCQRSHWHSGHKDKCDEIRLSCKSSLQGKRNSTAVSLVPGTSNASQIKKILFPYDKFLELFNWKNQGYPPCGLLNCGNSCFANVVLQCLVYTRPLAAYLLEKGHRRGCRRNDWCFLCEFQAHMERACQSNHAFSPINILSRLPNIGGNLGQGKQEDAHEFMRFVIDTMQSVCLDEYGGERAVHPSSQETTLIQHIFGGRLQSQVICTKCNNVSNQFENMMDLTVEIHGDAASLEECLDQFTVKEWLDGDNKYKCDGCNDYVLAWKRLNINRAPNILTIALKRFQSGRFGKLNKRVTFPETLDLNPYMSEAADGNDIYKLYAVVVHVDMLNASYFGHYICFTKDFSGNWYRIDDCKVEAVELDEVLSQGAYMLLYSRVSARDSCLNPVEEISTKDEVQTSNVSQQKAPVVSQPADCLLTTESVDATENCVTVLHANDLSANISTSQNSSNCDTGINTADSESDSPVLKLNGDCGIETSDSKPDSSVSKLNRECGIETTESNSDFSVLKINGDCGNDTADSNSDSSVIKINEDCGIDCTDAIENETEANKPDCIQSDVDENMKDNIENSSFSSSNGKEANDMESVNLECKPVPASSSTVEDESKKPVKKTPSAAKLKPLISSGFLSKRSRKVTNIKKDEKALQSENGSLKNNDILVVNGGSSDVRKEEGCVV